VPGLGVSVRTYDSPPPAAGRQLARTVATEEPLRLAGNRALARVLAPHAGTTLSRCACAAKSRARADEFSPELDALRQAAVARRTLARVCAPAAECAAPHTSLTTFVQETEAKPENKTKADKRADNCSAHKPECTSDGHAAVATALTALLQDRSPSRLDHVSGIFVNKDMPEDWGAVTVGCTSFVPALPENGGKKFCVTVPDTMEAEAKQYANPKIPYIGGVPRYAWVTRTLMTLTHETEHGRFDTAAGTAGTPLHGPAAGTCKPDDVESDLSELAAQMAEFPVLMRRTQTRTFIKEWKQKKLSDWFNYHLNNGGEDVTGTLKALRCKCECGQVDAYIKQVAQFAQASWTSWEKWVYNTEMKKPEHKLDWPVDPPASVDVKDLPQEDPVIDPKDKADVAALPKAK
jgi:hypothetical protein